MKSVHPFPARMAPDLALERLADLEADSLVLDPMAGSGTVLRQATELGHRACGFDMDPLAVLMARVWTTPVEDAAIGRHLSRILEEVADLDSVDVDLPWIDDDHETRDFVEYWFGERQRTDLRKLAHVLIHDTETAHALDVLRLALSRIIVTKEQSASLARDTSHSRPHKVCKESNFAIIPAFERSVRQMRATLAAWPPRGETQITVGDARRLKTLENGEVDAVLTSPPYLNAIDYLRGHRMSLVWLGHRCGELRRIRSQSIGAERAPDNPETAGLFARITDAMGSFDELSGRHRRMIQRYAEDLFQMVSEIARVLRDGGTATFVVGNSCLKGVFVRNAAGVSEAARMVGLTQISVVERELPENRRYLPITTGGQLGKRMRTETICSFVK